MGPGRYIIKPFVSSSSFLFIFTVHCPVSRLTVYSCTLYNKAMIGIDKCICIPRVALLLKFGLAHALFFYCFVANNSVFISLHQSVVCQVK